MTPTPNSPKSLAQKLAEMNAADEADQPPLDPSSIEARRNRLLQRMEQIINGANAGQTDHPPVPPVLLTNAEIEVLLERLDDLPIPLQTEIAARVRASVLSSLFSLWFVGKYPGPELARLRAKGPSAVCSHVREFVVEHGGPEATDQEVLEFMAFAFDLTSRSSTPPAP